VWGKSVWLVEEDDLNENDLVRLVEDTFNLPHLEASLAVIDQLYTLEANCYTCEINRDYIPDDAKNAVLESIRISLEEGEGL